MSRTEPAPKSALTDHRSTPDRIALSTSGTVGLVAITAVLGAVVLPALPRLAGWVLGFNWVPFAGPLRLARELDAYVAWWVLGLVGLGVGAVVGLGLAGECVVVTVDGREIVVTAGKTRSRYARAQVSRIALDGRRLSLRDDRDVDLVTQKIDGDPVALTAALRRHGWPTPGA